MALPRSNFPADFEQSVERPHCLIHENNGQELWLSKHSLNPQKSKKNVLNIQPFAVDFQMEVGGHTAIPVTIAGYQKALRYGVARWLSDRRYAENYGNTSPVIEFLQHRLCPEIFEDGHFSILRPLGHKGQEVELDRSVADHDRDGDGLILPHNGEAMTDEQLAALFPESEAIRVALFDVIRLPNIRPVYSERTYQATFGAEKKMITEKTERTEVPKGPLTPEMREILEKYGKIVYERIAPDADRVLICFKHFHGSEETPLFLSLKGQDDMNFRKHQQNLVAIYKEVLQTSDIHSLRFYNETFIKSFASGTEKEKESIKHFALLSLAMRTTEKNIALCKNLADAIGTDERFLRTVLFGYEKPHETCITYCLQHGYSNQLFGDGRNERWDDEERILNSADSNIEIASKFRNQTGVAADTATFRGQKIDINYRLAHNELTAQVASSLGSGNIGLLTYGARHFSSGLTGEEAIPQSLEAYFSYLPRTQVVVLEEEHYPFLSEPYNKTYALLSKNPAFMGSNMELANSLYLKVLETRNLFMEWHVVRTDAAQNKIRLSKLCASVKDLIATMRRLDSQM